MSDILEAGMYSLIFLSVSLVILFVGYLVLDGLTPGHKIGERLKGSEVTRQGVTTTEPSHSAALVLSAWMLAQGAIIYTAIVTNSHGTDFGEALGWTVAFSIIGLALQSVAFIVLDALTPGNLGDEVCEPGPANALAKVASANIIAIGLIVIASIS